MVFVIVGVVWHELCGTCQSVYDIQAIPVDIGFQCEVDHEKGKGGFGATPEVEIGSPVWLNC